MMKAYRIVILSGDSDEPTLEFSVNSPEEPECILDDGKTFYAIEVE